MARGAARRRRPAGGAPGRAAACSRRGAVHRGRRAPGDAALRPSSAARTASARVSLDLGPALELPGVRAAVSFRRGRRSSRSEAGYPGAALAGVAADTFEQAQAAVEAIAVEWEAFEPLLDPDEAVARGQLLEEPSRYERGDLDGALATADVVVEAEYRTAVRAPQRASRRTAPSASGRRTRSRCYISTQYIWGVRSGLATAFGIPRDRVRVICEFMGGGFGAKNGAGDYTLVAAELARRTGRPVRCALTRREENLAAGNRNATIQRLRVGARSDGTLVGLGGDFVNATGWGGWVSGTDGPMQLLYACENVSTTLARHEAQLRPDGRFPRARLRRGHVRPRMPARRARCEARTRPARAAAAQPRRRRPPRRPSVLVEEPARVLPARRAPLGAPRTRCAPARPRPWKHGVGLASQIWYGGGGPPSYAWVRVTSDARATVVTAMQDIGTGSRTAMAQIAAEQLGLPLDHVTVELGDTARGPYATLSAGSSTIPSMGPGGAGRGRRRRGPDPRARGAALAPRGAHPVARRAATSSAPTAARGRSPTCSTCSAARRSSAPARAGRTRPACGC